MFFEIFLAIAALLLLVYFSAPAGQVVHASRTKEMIFRQRRFPMAGLYTDPDGNRLLTEDRILGRVSGDSCLDVGIRDGDVIVARKMSDSVWRSVQPGDVVVIDSPVNEEKAPMRLRVVEGRHNGKLTFVDDGYGKLEPKAQKYVAGKVEFAGAFGR